MNDTLNFAALAATAYPSITTIKASIEVERDSLHPAVALYKLELQGPGFEGTIKTQGLDETAAITAAKKPYAQARRRHEVGELLRECRRLSEGALDNETLENWEFILCAASFSEYTRLSAKCRSQAVQAARQHAA